MSISVRSLLAQSALAITVLVAGTSVNSAQAAWKETVLNQFEFDKDGSGNGYRPLLGVLLVGSTAYGVTTSGGINNGGVVYRRSNGKMKALYSFSIAPPKDSKGNEDKTKWCGYQPSSSLIKDPSKFVLYGTTYYGGKQSEKNEDGSEYDGGVIFSLTPGSSSTGPWTCKVIHSFTKKNSTAGFAPFGGLIFGSDGLLYGTTQYNAVKTTSGVKTPTGGVVFRIAKTGGSFEVLHSFSATSQGLIPAGPVVEGPGGVLYGATFFGGAGNAGTIYKLAKSGAGYAVLHSFRKGSNDSNGAVMGFQPTQGALALDPSGNLYGATTLGGCDVDVDNDPLCKNSNSLPGGVVFTLKTSGSGYKVLHRFDSGSPGIEKGYSPYGGLVINGSFLYGVTQFGGPQNSGVAFRFKKASPSEYGVLAGFGDDFGRTPAGPLTLDAAGNVYGTASFGGHDNGGVLYFLEKP